MYKKNGYLESKIYISFINAYFIKYSVKALLGISRAIAPENLTLYLFTLSHSTIAGDYWGDRT
jgi:hypothetical protein